MSTTGSSGLEVLAGIGVGGFIGLAMGLSASPVVSVVLGGAATALVTLLGLQDQSASADRRRRNSWRILGFTFGGIALMLAGLYIRTHNLLSPSLAAQKEELKGVLTETEIHSILLQRALQSGERGAESPGKEEGQKKESRETRSGSGTTRDSSLYAGQGAADACEVASRNYSSTANFWDALKDLKGKYQDLAASLARLPAAEQDKMRVAVKEFLCAP